MRPKERIDRILSKLSIIWNKYPDMRLGQLLENFIYTRGERGDKTSVRLFYQEDDTTEDIIDEILKELD